MANSLYAPTWTRILTFILFSASLLIAGWKGGGLFLSGILATGLFLYASWQVVLLFSSQVQQGTKPMPTMVSFFIALGFKIPIFLVLGFYIRNLEFRFQACFLLGLAVVYSWLVGWAVNRQQSNPDTQVYGSDTADNNPSGKR